MEFRPGSVIDERYRVVSVAQHQDLVTALEATRASTAQPVVIKVFTGREEGGGTEGESSRLLQELQRVASLKHPHISALLEWGRLPDKRLYAVWDAPEGTLLSKALATGGPFTTAEAHHIMIQVLDALSYAHRQGLEHRTLSPAKILLCEGGLRRNAVVTDFAEATLLEAAQGVRKGSLTGATGTLASTAYLSPCQLDCQVSAGADLYSWGLILSECLTGRPAISGTPMDLIRELASGDPIPLPDALKDHPFYEIIRRATYKDSAKRYRAASQIYRELLHCAVASVPPPDEPQDTIEARQHRLAMFTEQQQWELALEQLEQLWLLEDRAARRAKYFFTAAILVRDQLGDVDRAVDLFNRTLDDDVDAMRAFSHIESMLRATASHDKLVDCYQRMIKRLERLDDPHHNKRRAQLWVRLAYTYRDDLGEPGHARACLDHALRLKPDDEVANQLLAELSPEGPRPAEG